MSQAGQLTVRHEHDHTHGALDFRVRRRDRYSIELKFRHLLDPEQERFPRRRSTRIRVLFFLPYSFNIRPDTLEPEEFYDDVKLYVRFNTPAMGIDELLGTNATDSPLWRLGRLLTHPASVDTGTLRYEAKLLGSITKSVLRDSVNERTRGVERVEQSRVDGFCAIVNRLHESFDAYRRVLESDDLPESARTHLRLVDEHLSLTIENYLVRMLTDRTVKRSGVSLQPLRDAIRVQQEYRRGRRYRSVACDPENTRRREEYIYRSKMLKHYAASVLFFEIRRGNQARRVEHLLYAVAAGIAMAIATGISFIGQVRFGALSTTLFLVLVVGYMIKDRLKDAIRAAFQRTLGRLFYDRRTVFKDQSTHKAMGVVKERTMFVQQHRLEPELLAARARGGFEEAIMRTNPEQALEYTKLLRIHERRLHRMHRRITGLADINIIDVKNLLRYLARQRETVPVVEDGEVRLEETNRIYHLNMLISANVGTGEQWHKVRLVVDAGGIRRVERP